MQVSKCHSDCDMLQWSYFARSPISLAKCCGSGGYQCKLGEGVCQVDSDCEGILTCGRGDNYPHGSCLWTQPDGSVANCCVLSSAESTAYALRAHSLAIKEAMQEGTR